MYHPDKNFEDSSGMNKEEKFIQMKNMHSLFLQGNEDFKSMYDLFGNFAFIQTSPKFEEHLINAARMYSCVKLIIIMFIVFIFTSMQTYAENERKYRKHMYLLIFIVNAFGFVSLLDTLKSTYPVGRIMHEYLDVVMPYYTVFERVQLFSFLVSPCLCIIRIYAKVQN